MKSIENRLTAIEKAVAATQLVHVVYKDVHEADTDLLRAVSLLLSGAVRTITAPWKPGEQEKYLSETVLELEKYFDTMHEEKAAAQQLVTELFDCLENGILPPDELVKTGRAALIEFI